MNILAGRGSKEYSGDHSAFDVFVEFVRNEKKGFIGIEVKYSENLEKNQMKLQKEII
ncbi:MAG: hypothetical protein IPL53_08415 [Ignavibacteria bacterium]|nr:hypothetical protein [Ignavibacteria bacterium]